MKRSLAFLLLCAQAFAEEAGTQAPKIEPSLFVEGYQSFNFTNAANYGNGINNWGHQYDSMDAQPSLALVETGLTVSQGEGEAHISFLFGPGAGYLFGDPAKDGLWEAHASYKPGDWTFTFGRRVTHMGYEAIRTDQNWNLSKSLLFLTAPTLQVGLSAGYSPEESLSFTGYYYGGWDGLSEDGPSIQGKALGAKVEWSPFPSLALTFAGLTGALPYGDPMDLLAQRLFETYAVWDATDSLSFALHVEVGDSQSPITSVTGHYWGFALYGRFQTPEGWAVALRLEEVVDESNLFWLYGVGDSIAPHAEAREITLTCERRFTENLLARLEGRWDQPLNGGIPLPAFSGGLSDEQVTLTAGVLFGL